MNIPEKFCIVPWVHLSVGLGGLSPCCRTYNSFVPEDLNAQSIMEAFNGNTFQRLRERLLQGKGSVHCSECYDTENNGKNSHRVIYNRLYDNELRAALSNKTLEVTAGEIQFIDYRPSNTCNLSCRTCGPHFSTAWNKDAMRLGLIKDPIIATQTLDLSEFINCKNYYFAGGEPLLENGHFEFLKQLINNNQSANLTLSYNTNLSISRSRLKKFISLWQQFKHVNVSASIDHTSSTKHQYIRNGINHKLVMSNFTLISATENITPFIYLTLSLYNVLDIHTIISQLLNDYKLDVTQIIINLLYAPDMFSIQNLPNCSKKIVTNNIRALIKNILVNYKIAGPAIEFSNHLYSILNHMNKSRPSDLLTNFHTYNSNLDDIRHQDFDTVFVNWKYIK